VDRVSAGMDTGQKFTLRATEAELESVAEAYLASSSVQDLAIWLERDGAYVSVQVRALGWRTLSAHVRLCASQGHLHLEGLKAELDGRALPRFVEYSAQKAANDALADLHLSVSFAEVTHSEGAVRLAIEPY